MLSMGKSRTNRIMNLHMAMQLTSLEPEKNQVKLVSFGGDGSQDNADLEPRISRFRRFFSTAYEVSEICFAVGVKICEQKKLRKMKVSTPCPCQEPPKVVHCQLVTEPQSWYKIGIEEGGLNQGKHLHVILI